MLAAKPQSSEVHADLVTQTAALSPNKKLILLIKVLHSTTIHTDCSNHCWTDIILE